MSEQAPGLLSAADACKWLSCSPKQLYILRRDRGLPTVQFGPRAVRFDIRDLQAWVDTQKQRRK